MADLADPAQSPSVKDETATGNGNGVTAGENRGIKRPRVSNNPDDDDDDDDKPGRERRKIDIKFIQDKSRRHITFSKRKAGIMKKVSLLHLLYTSKHALSQERLRLLYLIDSRSAPSDES